MHGCISGPQTSQTHEVSNPFAAQTLQIHPLTQIDPNPRMPDGTPDPRPRILLHLELKDRYGDTVKALGTFHAELFKSDGGLAQSMEERVMDWTEQAFLDPVSNTGRFDPATRTYRIALTGPAWLSQWKSQVSPPVGSQLRLRVTYSTTDQTGAPLVLESTYVFTR